MSTQTLFSDDYGGATLEAESGLLRYVRTTTPFPTIESMRAHYAELSRSIGTMHPEKLNLLLDVRAAPPRNDEAFEKEIAATVGALFDRFHANAFVVKTAVGNLQVRRLSATRGSPTNNVFTDEASAVAFLSRQSAGH